MRRLIGAGLIALAAFAVSPAAAQGPAVPADGAVLILVRHAETQPDGTRNPPLSPEGQDRARRLAEVLVDADLDAVYSTDYIRTRDTATPVAERLSVAVTLYDPGDLPTFAGQLLGRGGRALVVGHSNTTPALVEALGGEPGAPIIESEHDRLYVLVAEADRIRTIQLRY
jgi:phosphohistidine phosphatase SixA